jgi:hypothetical protein
MDDFDPDNPASITGPDMKAPWKRVYADFPVFYHPDTKHYAVPMKDGVRYAIGDQHLIECKDGQEFIWSHEVPRLCATYHRVRVAFKAAMPRKRVIRRTRPSGRRIIRRTRRCSTT